LTIDFHTHTYHSYDCLMEPEKILRLAKERGLNGIVVNDHNTIKGGLECCFLNKDPNFLVITGAEIKTSIGDVTGLFLKEEIVSRNFNDVVSEIRKQGGLTVLNHPYVAHDLDGLNFKGIDLIEGYNGRLPAEKNQKAIDLAKQHNIPIVGGSDAHTYAEIGNCRTHYATFSNLLEPLESEYQQCSVWAPIMSQFIKAGKRKDLVLFFKVLLGAPRKIVKNL
jgi:predicted metal-dependent phosphoesterase TrpH